MSNIQVSVRITPELYEKLLTHTNTVGLSKSKVIAQALSQYLETDEKEPSSLEERLLNVEKRLDNLESSPISDQLTPNLSTTKIASQTSLSFETPPLEKFSFETPIIDETGTILERVKGTSPSFTEDLGEGVISEMVYIPEGSFLMGASSDEAGSQICEQIQHSVNFKGFFLGKFPITQKQWEIVAQYPKINRD